MAMSPERRGALFLWGGVGLLLFGLMQLFWGGWNWWHADRASHWPEVPGVVESSEVHLEQHSGGISYRPVVVYRYRVDGVWYRSSRYDYNVSVANRSQAEAQEIVDRYPAGTEVTVYHDPNDPGDAVLNPGAEGSNTGYVAFSVLFIAGGVFLVGKWLRMDAPPMQ